jgi:nitrate reductase gamma subunit
MEPAEAGGLLHVAEAVHWTALTIMVLVYAIRLFWLFRFKAGRDRQRPGERYGDTSLYPALYSMANVGMPWVMESTRKNIPFYLSFVVFHIGVAAGIFFAIVGSAYRPFVEIPAVTYVLMVLIGAAFVVAVGRVIRRFARPVLRLISTPDDYFSLMTLTVWFGVGVAAAAYTAGLLKGEGYWVAYLFATSFFLIYVPFSKISHYLYYPFTRYWIGRTLGHRGSMPPAVARG